MKKRVTRPPKQVSLAVSEKLRPLINSTIAAAKDDPRTPSIKAATAYATDNLRHTDKEREIASLAMDFNGTSLNALSFVSGTSFPGFPTLALLSQLPEYRSMHERLADECIRAWGQIVSSGAADDERKAQLEAELKRHEVRQVIRQLIIDDQAFGGGHVLFKLKNDEDLREIPLVLRSSTVRRNSFEGLRVIEPYWVTPNYYNSIDPSAADFYKPSSWFMLAQQVHATRLQTIISRPVPDMLKPTYSFRGISMTQLAMPYVDNFLRTRQSVSDAVKQYAVSGILTDLQQSLLPGADISLQNRAELINAYRDNRNLLMLDKATEEFFTVTTPLTGLDALQAQSQEQMSAVSHIPLVVLLGITPTGLNASSEGEIRVFYDYVKGYQQNTLSSLMLNILRVMQLSLFGEIDEDINWVWEPLLELSALEQSELRKNDSEVDERYIVNGVVTPEMVTRRLNTDANSLYSDVIDDSDPLSEVEDDDIQGIAEIMSNMQSSMSNPQNSPDTNSTPADIDDVNASLSFGNTDPSITDPDENEDPGTMAINQLTKAI